MISWSTDELRPHERFDHWCEVRSRNLFGVTISLAPEERLSFRGRFSAVAAGNATLSEMRASAYRVARSEADIARAPSDALCIYEQVGGASWFDSRGSGQFVIHAGRLAISHTERPYFTEPMTSRGFDLRVLKIPLEGRGDLAGAARGLHSALIEHDPRLVTVLSAALRGFREEAAEEAGTDLGLAVDHLACLALIAHGRLGRGAPESRAALRFGFFNAARAIIRRDLGRPDLSPQRIAGELGISLRQVHLLFEPTGLSFSRTVLALRLAEARRMLAERPARQVTEIAFDCGFDSLSTFYRAFRLAHGMTATDMRVAAALNG